MLSLSILSRLLLPLWPKKKAEDMCTIQQQRVADRQRLRAPVVYPFAPFVDTFPVGFTRARKRETWKPQYRHKRRYNRDLQQTTGHVCSISTYLPAIVLDHRAPGDFFCFDRF